MGFFNGQNAPILRFPIKECSWIRSAMQLLSAAVDHFHSDGLPISLQHASLHAPLLTLLKTRQQLGQLRIIISRREHNSLHDR